MRRFFGLLAFCSLTGCGSKKETTAPPVLGASTVRASDVVFGYDATVKEETVSFTATNLGIAGQWRYGAWSDDTPLGCEPTLTVTGCLPKVFCRSSGVLIAAQGTARVSAATCPSVVFGLSWVVIETQDPASTLWVRTACLAKKGDCPTIILPER